MLRNRPQITQDERNPKTHTNTPERIKHPQTPHRPYKRIHLPPPQTTTTNGTAPASPIRSAYLLPFTRTNVAFLIQIHRFLYPYFLPTFTRNPHRMQETAPQCCKTDRINGSRGVKPHRIVSPEQCFDYVTNVLLRRDGLYWGGLMGCGMGCCSVFRGGNGVKEACELSVYCEKWL